MKNLWILVKMQLKEQLNFKRLEVENVNKFHVIASVIGAVLKFALVTGLCLGFLFASQLLGIFGQQNAPIPGSVISLVFWVMFIASVFSSIIGLTQAMYYARDNAVLLTLPCRPIQVYLSKLIIFFIFEIKRNFSFLIPLFVAHFILGGYGFFAYPWLIFAVIWISLLEVSIGALLSIPAMWIANFFKQHKRVQHVGIGVVVALAAALLFFAISLIPEDINPLATWRTTFWKIQDFLTGYMTRFSTLYDITLVLLGEARLVGAPLFPIGKTLLRLSYIILPSIVFLGIGFLVVRPLFYKMASTPFEYLKKSVPPKKNTVRRRRISAVTYEYLIAFKSSSRMLSSIGTAIAIPMLTFFLNKTFLAMNTRELGEQMVVAFNVLIILLVALNSNCYAASIFSKQGRSSYLLKTQPSKYPLLVLSKLLPGTSFTALALIGTLGILLVTLPISKVDTLLLVLSIGMTYIAHMLYCAQLDLMNPQTELYATVGQSESNPNETKAALTAFLISFAIAGGMFLLFIAGPGMSVYLKFFVIALLALLYKIHIFFQKLRLYFKEK